MTEAVLYTRVSSREQQEGFSLGAQSKFLHEYSDRQGFQIVKAFEDVETAKTSGRKQFSEMVTWFKGIDHAASLSSKRQTAFTATFVMLSLSRTWTSRSTS